MNDEVRELYIKFCKEGGRIRTVSEIATDDIIDWLEQIKECKYEIKAYEEDIKELEELIGLAKEVIKTHKTKR